MNKGEAERIAKRTLRYGYFDRGSHVEVNCPMCRKAVTVQHFCGRAQVKKLAPTLVEHLVCWCAETVSPAAHTQGAKP